jgi:hypothetical protein
MPYLYDVFIFYKRERINEQWLNEIFLAFFENYPDNELLHKTDVLQILPRNFSAYLCTENRIDVRQQNLPDYLKKY